MNTLYIIIITTAKVLYDPTGSEQDEIAEGEHQNHGCFNEAMVPPVAKSNSFWTEALETDG
jgi:hypothetical protein